MRALYVCLLCVLAPFYLASLWLAGRGRPEHRGCVRERLGDVTAPELPVAVWVHAVSVGETLAALPLIRALVQRHGRGRIWVTSGTPTGRARVRAALADQVLHSYAPLDLPLAVRRFIGRIRPQKMVVIETEIWPSLYRRLRLARIPILVVNARISDRSWAGYRRYRHFMREVFADITLVAAQSRVDAERFRALGAPRVVEEGNIKFDAEPDAMQAAAGRALREQLGGGRPVWLAASTHAGEETAALAAHRVLLRTYPDALLILVPRHPQRFEAVAAEIAAQGLRCVRRSAALQDPAAPVLLGDSMGEMWLYLAAADLAFVGGSLVPVGGHNVLEPAAMGLPVLFGPHMGNFIAARDALLASGAARQVADASELAAVLVELFCSAAARAPLQAAALAAIDCHRGALRRVLAHIDPSPAAGAVAP